MFQFSPKGVIGSLVYLSCLCDNYQLTVDEIIKFTNEFVKECEKIDEAVCKVGYDEVVKFCDYHSEIAVFDKEANSIIIKKDNNAVITELYFCTIYIAGTGTKKIFNDVFDLMYPKEVKWKD